MLTVWTTILLGVAVVRIALARSGPSDGSDLASYVTRPEMRPPILNVVEHDPEAVTPGYIFLAPYASIYPSPERREYRPCQEGPHIYDRRGELVWSGACLMENRNSFGLMPQIYNGKEHLTFSVGRLYGPGPYHKHAAIIMNSAFEVVKRITARFRRTLDIHEFAILDGKAALYTFYDVEKMPSDTSALNVTGYHQTKIANGGFQERDIKTGRVLFEWRALPHVSIGESHNAEALLNTRNQFWDFFHINSVDKNSDGDYMVSARFTDTIYKISGVDGKILWRLGGIASDFQLLDGFNFSSQHHARWHSQNETHTIVSFFNNAADDESAKDPTSTISAGFLVALDTTAMTARVVTRWDRPDGALTYARGSTQILENGNAFICWGDSGYVSEFTIDGRCILDAKFKSGRFTSYRGNKFNFTGNPKEPPILVTHAYHLPSGGSTSVHYVSWNGATEVAAWNFYGSGQPEGPFELLGIAEKSGFETTFISEVYSKWNYVEAISRNGTILGKSVTKSAIKIKAAQSTSYPRPELPATTSSHSPPIPIPASPQSSTASASQPKVSAAPKPGPTAASDRLAAPNEVVHNSANLTSGDDTPSSSNDGSFPGPNSPPKTAGAKTNATGIAGALIIFAFSFASGWYSRSVKDRWQERKMSTSKGKYMKVELQPLVKEG